jgi:hypothetical protein
MGNKMKQSFLRAAQPSRFHFQSGMALIRHPRFFADGWECEKRDLTGPKMKQGSDMRISGVFAAERMPGALFCTIEGCLGLRKAISRRVSAFPSIAGGCLIKSSRPFSQKILVESVGQTR